VIQVGVSPNDDLDFVTNSSSWNNWIASLDLALRMQNEKITT